MLTYEAWTAIGLVVLTLGALASGRVSADAALVTATSLLVFLGILTPREALAPIAGEGIATIAALFVLVCGLTRTGAVAWIGQRLLGRARTLRAAQARLLIPVTAFSGFMNNTPLVAMFIPVVIDWCRRCQQSPSKFLIPLSYATILGGTCTLIGTSTNLVVHDMWLDAGFEEMGLFRILPIGLPVAIVGMIYVLVLAPRLLPARVPTLSYRDDARSYTAEMIVDAGGPLVGRTIDQAGLRHLPALYLAEIHRGDRIIPAVAPDEVLQAGDRLVFVGVVDSIVDLQRVRGLTAASDQTFKLAAPRPERILVEAVISASSPLISRTIREARFRTTYGAVVIAVARHGERINRKIGDISIQPGDTLLVEAPRRFLEVNRHSPDFYLMTGVADSAPVRHERAGLALAILAMAILVAALPIPGVSMLHAAVLGAGLMVATRCCTGYEARRAVDWSLLVTIAAAIALGSSLEKTGAAEVIAGGIVDLAGGNAWITLALVYVVTMIFTEIITNAASAALTFGLAHAAAERLGVNFTPFAMCIMMAASASFSTPIGYQTNLMVQSPGGYRFTDYLRFGAPMNILAAIVTIPLAALIWPLEKIAQ